MSARVVCGASGRALVDLRTGAGVAVGAAEVHVRAGEDGSVWVWALALGTEDPWQAHTWASLRTRDGGPLLVHALRVASGEAGVRLGWALHDAALEQWQACRLYVRGVLVSDFTPADVADLAIGRENY